MRVKPTPSPGVLGPCFPAPLLCGSSFEELREEAEGEESRHALRAVVSKVVMDRYTEGQGPHLSRSPP